MVYGQASLARAAEFAPRTSGAHLAAQALPGCVVSPRLPARPVGVLSLGQGVRLAAGSPCWNPTGEAGFEHGVNLRQGDLTVPCRRLA